MNITQPMYLTQLSQEDENRFRFHFRMFIDDSVTRSGDFLDFGQLVKAFGNNLFAQISHILKEFL